MHGFNLTEITTFYITCPSWGKKTTFTLQLKYNIINM